MSLEQVLTTSTTGVVSMDREGVLRWANPAARALLGLLEGAADSAVLDDLWTVLPAAVRAPGAPHDVSAWSGEMTRRGGDGLVRTLSVEAVVGRDVHGVVHEATMLLRDVSETTRLHAELLFQASHDALTGLPNRAHLRRVSAEAVERLRANGGTMALLFVDLDHVKEVNDVAGHDVGDQVIVYAGQRLAASIRPHDVVARLGGDEFVVVCEGMADTHAALEVAERVRRTLSERVDLCGRTLSVAASVGVAVVTADAARDDDRPAVEVADALLQQADSAMYRAKQRGRGRSELFDDELGRQLARRRLLGDELGRAVTQSSLQCSWMPVTDLVRDTVSGWQVSVGWRPADGGDLGHDEIMDLAISTGLEQAVGQWLLDHAPEAPPLPGRPRILVPCTPAHLRDPHAVDRLRAVAQRLGATSTSLVVLVDEAAIVGTDPELDRTLHALPRYGIGVGVTGVGRSATPLRRLGSLPLERLVLDASLVADLGTSPTAEALTRSLIHLGHTLDVVVGAQVGPGDAASLARRTERLRALGCDDVIGRPMAPAPRQEFTAT